MRIPVGIKSRALPDKIGCIQERGWRAEYMTVAEESPATDVPAADNAPLIFEADVHHVLARELVAVDHPNTRVRGSETHHLLKISWEDEIVPRHDLTVLRRGRDQTEGKIV